MIWNSDEVKRVYYSAYSRMPLDNVPQHHLIHGYESMVFDINWERAGGISKDDKDTLNAMLAFWRKRVCASPLD